MYWAQRIPSFSVHNIVQQAVTKTILKKKKCNKLKWLFEKVLQIAEKRWETKGKEEKERYTCLNAEFQGIARRDKVFLSEQCKEIEENKEWERLEISVRILEISRNISYKDGHNGMGLTEAEDIKKRWQEYILLCVSHSIVLVTQLCPTLCNPMDCRLPRSSAHGVFPTRILELVAIPFSRGYSQPRDQTWVFCIGGRFFTVWATTEVLEYTEELYKKYLNDPDNHDGVITPLEPDILECKVKWTLGSITMNKASGGDGIPAELFKILKDYAVKCCTQYASIFGKLSSGCRTR